ncbi:MAG: 30S ribosomal protein S9 [Planctomycetes bacterium]|nr:30S ribosomal protein S9 [Planctomycetota bacterium]
MADELEKKDEPTKKATVEKKSDDKSQAEFIWGVGRRKSSVARVRILPGSGKIIVNKKDYKVFFPRLDHQNTVTMPLNDTDTRKDYDIWIKVNGGGITGQSGAARLGIARAILKAGNNDEEMMKTLKENEHLTRDGSMKERKKYGRHGARRGFQFSKR